MNSVLQIGCTVTLTTDILLSVALCGNLLNSKDHLSLPSSTINLSDLSTALDFARLCIGNSEQSFIEVVKH